MYEKRDAAFDAWLDTHRNAEGVVTLGADRVVLSLAFNAGWNARKTLVDYALPPGSLTGRATGGKMAEPEYVVHYVTISGRALRVVLHRGGRPLLVGLRCKTGERLLSLKGRLAVAGVCEAKRLSIGAKP